MSEPQSIQWFPGHMTKTKRKIEASLKLVDVIAEIIDARIPVSSRNPELSKIINNKPRVIVMNKSDMADPAETKRWIAYYRQNGITAAAVDCKSGKGLNAFVPMVREVLKDRIAAWEAKGMGSRPVRIMVVGIPNVGKSSFINKMAGGGKAKVEDRPGVTRGNQWFSVAKGNGELLDTPGVLWPKFDDPAVGERLAFTGAIKDAVTDTEQLACRLLEQLKALYAEGLRQRYKLQDTDISGLQGDEILSLIGKKRGMLIAGGEIDLERTSNMVLDEFRSGKLGSLTLEVVE